MEEPFGILLELVAEQRLDPWEIEIGRLISQWIENLGSLDLRICGRGIYSASVLLRMKSELNGNGHQPQVVEESEIPELPDVGPILLAKYCPRRIQLTELLSALREAIEEMGEWREPPQRRPQLVKEQIPLSTFERQIEKLMEVLLEKIKSLGGVTEFSQLLERRTRLAAVRLFLLLLFLASDGKVFLRQENGRIEVRANGT